MTKLSSALAIIVAIVFLAVLPFACSATGDRGEVFDNTGTGQGASGAGNLFGGAGGMGQGVGGDLIAGTETLSGRVMAPSGAFPVSGALVFLTQTDPPPIPSGVYHYECDDMKGKPYALSAADGTWSINKIPVGNYKLVTRKGNFRRIRDIQVTENMPPAVPEEMTTLPGAKTADGLDMIPSFAVVRTSPDLTYNLLAKFGMGQVNGAGELIDGTEQFSIYDDNNFGSYPHTSALFDNQATLHSYHMIFLPCYASSVGVQFVNSHVQMLRDYVAAGGRIYNSCTVSLWSEATFPDYIDFYQSDNANKFDIGRRTNSAYTTTGEVLDEDLAAWIGIVTPNNPQSVPFENGYVTIDATTEVDDGHGLEKDNYIVKPFTWVRDNSAYPGSPLMVTYNYDYGKVFYSVYETSSSSLALTPQEYVLIYVILEVGVCGNLPPDIPK